MQGTVASTWGGRREVAATRVSISIRFFTHTSTVGVEGSGQHGKERKGLEGSGVDNHAGTLTEGQLLVKDKCDLQVNYSKNQTVAD